MGISCVTQALGSETDAMGVPQGYGSQYKIILQRRDPTIALLGDVLHLDLSIPAIASPIAALQRTFLGKFVPLEVFRVNMTALTPERLCSYLTHLNPGKSLPVPARMPASNGCVSEVPGQPGNRISPRVISRS